MPHAGRGDPSPHLTTQDLRGALMVPRGEPTWCRQLAGFDGTLGLDGALDERASSA